MIGFSQANDLSEMFPQSTKLYYKTKKKIYFFYYYLIDIRERSMTDCSNETTSTNDFCDEIDEIMKHEQEDVMSLNDSLPPTPLDLNNLESISDLLENPRSSNFTQALNINDLSSTQSNLTRTTSAYSSLGTNSKSTILSLNNNHFQHFIQSNNSHLPPYVHQQDNSILGASRSFELQSNTNGQSDVKRFRSASMNDGPSLQQPNKLGIFFCSMYSDWKIIFEVLEKYLLDNLYYK